jgi:hypothetical protein
MARRHLSVKVTTHAGSCVWAGRNLVWQVPLGGLGNAGPTGIEQPLLPGAAGKIAKRRLEARAA